MKTWWKLGSVRLVVFFIFALLIASPRLLAQSTNRFTTTPNFALTNEFKDNSYALNIITNLLDQPQPALVIPEVSETNYSSPGTYWTLASAAPWPYDPFPELNVYQVSTNFDFIIDDRSVNYAALAALEASNHPVVFAAEESSLVLDTNSLWIQVPTNSVSSPGLFNVVLQNTLPGTNYDVLTKIDLLQPEWSVEATVQGAAGNMTPVTIEQNQRTNLFLWARESIIPIYTQPMSQEVLSGDIVTFTVVAGGSGLSYQWTFDGTNIAGATSSSLTIQNVNDYNAGDYACIVSDADGTAVTATATLTVDDGDGWPYNMTTIGQRQDYTFRNGVTYTINAPIQLYGKTRIEGGAIIKFDYTGFFPCLQIMGSLDCEGESYNPAVLTTVDDDTFGFAESYGSPQPVVTGVPYLDLTYAGNVSLANLRFRYADMAVGAPAQSRLDVWDSQFVQCNAGVVSFFGGDDVFHNVLFSGGYTAVAGYTNSFAIEMEQVTSDVSNLWYASVSPSLVALTNSIILGSIGSAGSYHTQNIAVAPDASNFQTNGAGNYYLAATSSLHQSGTTNVSAQLLTEFQQKTTTAPMALPLIMNISGNMTFLPQAPRYTNGPPDIGYYYDVLDYTVAWVTVSGSVTLEPGVVVAVRTVPFGQVPFSIAYGFDVRENGSLVSHGMPNRPIIMADAQTVQEQDDYACSSLLVPDFEGSPSDIAPVFDFRFCKFYPPSGSYSVWGGDWEFIDFYDIMASPDSLVNWTMRDCEFHGGRLSLGTPDLGLADQYYGSGAVDWENNLFENVSVNLDTTTWWYDGAVEMDENFTLRNNLFRGGNWFVLEPVISSTGFWTLTDNLFDGIDFQADPNAPLNFDHNGYWPLPASQFLYNYLGGELSLTAGDSAELASGTNGLSGANEVVLDAAPPYASGPFGNYYLSTITPLWQAGSQTAGAAGLAQYTTFTTETKDPANQPVNIGFHYVAAGTNGLPLDTDGDGIPDYVEDANGNGIVDANETDWQNPMTDGINPDPSNSVYLDIDLSGDGLSGRVKAALGINPLDSSNPLTVQQVSTGQEPDIVGFEVPVNYNTVTNIGDLRLNVDGTEADFYELCQASDGNCLLKWNTTYSSPGFHYLSANFMVAGSWPDTAIFTGQNSVAPFLSTNVLQFYESDTMFDDSGAFLDAQLPEPDANYTIQLYDPSTAPPTFIKGITNSTSSGTIQETWDLTYDDGITIFTNDTVTAVFNVDLLDPASGTHTKTLHKLASNEQGNGFDFSYFYTPKDGSLSYDFGTDGGEVWDGMQAVVDTLLTPQEADSGSPNNYNSSFNYYTSEDNNPHGNGTSEGWPGYVSSRSTVTNSSGGLYPSMADGTTKNFYGYGHGTIGSSSSGKYLASYNYQGNAYISSAEVGSLLGNHFRSVGGLRTKNPYRFVFVDGCATMDTKDWRRAFGIFPLDAPNQAALNKVGAQAYVGWAKEHSGNYATADKLEAYLQTLDSFYGDWMLQVPLAECIQNASNPQFHQCPLPVPGNETVKDVNGNTFTDTTSKIYVSGHSGLTRTGDNTAWDNYKPYIPPPGNE